MEDYLISSKLPQNFQDCLALLSKKYSITLAGKGIDIAAGTCWLAPYILSCTSVEHLICLEYSYHRLLKLGPLVLQHYHVDAQKITLAYGSFYEIKQDDKSLDFVIASQAFHHASDPAALLTEIYRVLKDDGVFIIIGEHVVHSEAPPPDEMGDHYYTPRQYAKLFKGNHFYFEHLRHDTDFQSFVLMKKRVSRSFWTTLQSAFAPLLNKK